MKKICGFIVLCGLVMFGIATVAHVGDAFATENNNTTPSGSESTPATTGNTSAATATTTNSTDMNSAITDCEISDGIFTSLIAKGVEIFNGLREIIYVVAGFGILAVAVGGFFGNLNWKWLGAIIIGLMVIASTGEILTMITGCKGVVNITDTLK